MASRRSGSLARSAAGSVGTPGRRSTRNVTASPAPQAPADREPSRTRRGTRSVTPTQQQESTRPAALASASSSAYGTEGGTVVGEANDVSAGADLRDMYKPGGQDNAGEDDGDDAGSQSSKASATRRPGRPSKKPANLGTIDEEDSSVPSAAKGKAPRAGSTQGPGSQSGHFANDQLQTELDNNTTVLGQGNPAFRDVEVASDSAALANHVPQPEAGPPQPHAAAAEVPASRRPGSRASATRASPIPAAAAPVIGSAQTAGFMGWIRKHLLSTWPLLFLFFFALACVQASLFVPAVSEHHVALGLRSAESVAWDFTKSCMPKLSLRRSETSEEVLRRLFILETRVDTLSGMSDSTIKSLDRLKQVLPKEVVLQMRDGELHVPDTFWHALKSKFDDSHKSSITWESWLKANEAFMSSWVNKAFDVKIRNSTIVTSDEFADLVASNYDALAPQINAELTKRFDNMISRFDQVELTVADKAIATVDRKYEHMLTQLPAEYLASLADANIRKTTDLALRSYNYFNPLMGAMVDPHMSSPTKRSSQNKLASIYLWLKDRRELPPMTALRPWTDAGQCWCAAAPSREPGNPEYFYPKAQLTVALGRRMTPTHVTVEHIPRSGTLDKGSAPNFMELWVEMDDVSRDSQEKFRRVHDAGNFILGTQAYFNEKKGIQGRYARVATWNYDWAETAHHIQTFPLQVDLVGLGVSTSRVIVRAETNHGAEHTCIYRVRLHGKEA